LRCGLEAKRFRGYGRVAACPCPNPGINHDGGLERDFRVFPSCRVCGSCAQCKDFLESSVRGSRRNRQAESSWRPPGDPG